MDIKERNVLLARQKEDYERLLKTRLSYHESLSKFYQFFKDLDFSKFKFDESMPHTSFEALLYLANEKLNNEDRYSELISQIKEAFPDFSSGDLTKLIEETNDKKYKYFKEFTSYLNNLKNDYEKYFNNSYKKHIFNMAEKGVFILFETYPIFEEDLTDDTDKNIRSILAFFKYHNYENLVGYLGNIFEGKKSSNYLQSIKAKEFEDAVICLLNECYSSCARTMIALIENDHLNASNINADLFKPKKPKGIKRAQSISKQIYAMDIEFLNESWDHLNCFYKKLNAPQEERTTDFINRHDLVHGTYEKAVMPDADWCIKLILFYMSFKQISFILQETYDMYLEMGKDLICYGVNKKTSTKT